MVAGADKDGEVEGAGVLAFLPLHAQHHLAEVATATVLGIGALAVEVEGHVEGCRATAVEDTHTHAVGAGDGVDEGDCSIAVGGIHIRLGAWLAREREDINVGLVDRGPSEVLVELAGDGVVGIDMDAEEVAHRVRRGLLDGAGVIGQFEFGVVLSRTVAIGGFPLDAGDVEFAVLIEGDGEDDATREFVGNTVVEHSQDAGLQVAEVLDDGAEVGLDLDGADEVAAGVILVEGELDGAEEGRGEVGVVGQQEVHGGHDAVARGHLRRAVVGRGVVVAVAREDKVGHGLRCHYIRSAGIVVVVVSDRHHIAAGVGLEVVAGYHDEAEGVVGVVHYLVGTQGNAAGFHGRRLPRTLIAHIGMTGVAVSQRGEVGTGVPGLVHQVHCRVGTGDENAVVVEFVVVASRGGGEGDGGPGQSQFLVDLGAGAILATAVQVNQDVDILLQPVGFGVGQDGRLAQTDTGANLPLAVGVAVADEIGVGEFSIHSTPAVGFRINPGEGVAATVGGVSVGGVAGRGEAGIAVHPVARRSGGGLVDQAAAVGGDGGLSDDGGAVAPRSGHIAEAGHRTRHMGLVLDGDVDTIIKDKQGVTFIGSREADHGGGTAFGGHVAAGIARRRHTAQLLHRHKDEVVGGGVEVFLIEIHAGDVVQRGVVFGDVEAAEGHLAEAQHGVGRGDVGRGTVGGTEVVYRGVVREEAVGTLHALEFLGDVAVLEDAVVPEVDMGAHIAALHGSTAAEEAFLDVHLRQGAELVGGGVVAFAVDAYHALAAREAGGAESRLAGTGTPVGAGIDGVVENEVALRQFGREAARGAGFEFHIEAVGAVFGIHGRVGHAAVDGVGADVDIDGAVGGAEVSGAIEVALHKTAREVDDGGGTLGGVVGGDTFAGIAVADALGAAIEAHAYFAAIHVDDLEAIDEVVDAGAGIAHTAGTSEDVVQERAAMDIGDDIGVVLRVEARGIVEDFLAVFQHIGAGDGVFLVGLDGAEFAAAIEVALHPAVVEVEVDILGVGTVDMVGFIDTGGVAGVGIVAVAGTKYIIEASGVDVDFGTVDIAGEVVAAEEVLHEVDAVEVEVCGAEDIATPASAVEFVEGGVPIVVDGDVGVHHVATAAAAVGSGVAHPVGVVEVDMGVLGDVTEAAALEVVFVEVLVVTHTAAVEGAVDVQLAVVAVDGVVDDHRGGAAVGHGAAAIDTVDTCADITAPEVEVGAVDIGTGSNGDALVGTVGGIVGHAAVGVDAEEAVADFQIVVVTVGATEEVLHGAAADVDARHTGDGTRDVVAAEDIVHTIIGGIPHFDIGVAEDVAQAVAAKDGVEDGDVFAFEDDMGGDISKLVAVDIGDDGAGAALGASAHDAVVGATEDGVDDALLEPDVGHHIHHIVLVVAAEDGADGVDGAVGVVEEDHDGLLDAHAVATAEDGVDAAAAGVDVNEGRALLGGEGTAGVGAEGNALVFGTGAVIVVGTVTGAVDAVDGGGVLDAEVGRVVGAPGAVAVVLVEADGGVGGEHGLEGSDGVGKGVVVGEVAVDGAGEVVGVEVGAEGLDVAGAVVAAEEGAVDLHVTAQGEVGKAVDARLVAAAEGVALHTAAGGHEVDAAGLQTIGGARHRRKFEGSFLAGLGGGVVGQDFGRGAVLESHVGMHTAAVELAENQAAAEVEVDIVVRGEEHAHIVVVGVVGDSLLVVGIGVEEVAVVVVARAVVAVVETVGAGHGVADDEGVVVEHEVGAAAGLGADVARDVVAAVDIAEGAAGEVDTAGVLHITHAAATEDIVADNLRVGEGGDDGADLVGHGGAAIDFGPAARTHLTGGIVDIESLLYIIII